MPTEKGGHHSVQEVGATTLHYHSNACAGAVGDIVGYIVQDDLTGIVSNQNAFGW